MMDDMQKHQTPSTFFSFLPNISIKSFLIYKKKFFLSNVVHFPVLCTKNPHISQQSTSLNVLFVQNV